MNDLKDQVSILGENTELDENSYQVNQKLEKRKVSTKKSLTGKYYEHLLHKKPLVCLLIIGGILGCILSVYFISGRLSLWWWIPLSTMFLGPLGLVFIALILPFTPWIVYIILRIIFEILANA